MARSGDKLKIHLIGELRLVDNGHALPLPASRKTRALFVYLLQMAKPVRRERLCELFFDIPDDPRAALRWSLSKIRTMLCRHADALQADRERVEIRRDRLLTDVEDMQSWIAGAPVPGDFHAHAEAALEPPLAGLELSGLDAWNAWLAAERADIDKVRSAFLDLASQDKSLTPQHRRMFAKEARQLAEEVELVATPAPPLVSLDTPPAVTLDPPDIETAPAQHVRYCFARDGVRIAYACTGLGPPLVKAANWLNHLELDWTGPVWARLFRGLSRKHCLVRYDERGNGLSEWDVQDLGFDAFVTDLETVVDALGLERFPLLGISQGCAVSIEYAARHPERVTHLILLGGYAAGWRFTADEAEARQREAVMTLVETGWGEDTPVYRQIFSQTFMPSATPEEIGWFNEFQRRTASPANALRFLEAFSTINVRHRLGQIRCPTMVMHARNDLRIPLQMGIELASEIPGASLVTLDTDNHIPLSREPATERIIECVHNFLSGPAEPVTIHPRHWANGSS